MKKILFAIAAALMTATTLNAQTAAEQAQAQRRCAAGDAGTDDGAFRAK